jgi:DNA-binding CsgD family transcriptional regulator/tetratricopeptide (TPR) repeat protein
VSIQRAADGGAGAHEAGPGAFGDGVVTLEELAVRTGRPLSAVLPVVATAVAAGLLDASGSRLRFTSPEARTRVVLRLAGAEPEAPASTDRPVDWLRWTAGRVAVDAPGIAVELLQAALPLARDGDRQSLVADLAVALHAAGRHEEVETICRQALQSPPPGMEPVLRRVLVDSLFDRGLVEAAEHEAAVGAVSAPVGQRAWFVAARALPPLYSGEPERAEQLGRQAEAIAVAEGDDRALALALRARLVAAQQTLRLNDAGPLADRLLVTAGGLEPAVADANAHLAAALVFSDLDRHGDAVAQVTEASRLAGGLGQAVARHAALAYGGAILTWMGDWDQAIDRLRSASAAEGAGGWTVDVLALLAVLATSREGPSAAASWVTAAEAAQRAGDRVVWVGRLQWMRAEVAAAGGDHRAAVAHLCDGWEQTVRARMPREQRRIGPLLVRLAVAGDPAAPSAHGPAVGGVVESVVERLAAQSAANPHVAGLAGLARWTAGLLAGDGTLVMEALDLLRRSGRPHDAARCGLDAALLLGSDAPASASVVDGALGTLDLLGAAAERDRAVGTLRAAGLAPRRRRVAAGAGWAALTDSERRVAVLLADGLSNPEIAARLFISPRTVSTHVSHILRKLGLRSRTEVAVMVTRVVADENR